MSLSEVIYHFYSFLQNWLQFLFIFVSSYVLKIAAFQALASVSATCL